MNTTTEQQQQLTFNCMNGDNQLINFDDNHQIEQYKTIISNRLNINIYKLSIFVEGDDIEEENHYYPDINKKYFLLIKDVIDYEDLKPMLLGVKATIYDNYKNEFEKHIELFEYSYMENFIRDSSNATEGELIDAVAYNNKTMIWQLIHYEDMIKEYFTEDYDLFEEIFDNTNHTKYLTNEEIDEFKDSTYEIFDEFIEYIQ